MRGPGNKRSAAASVTATKDRTVVQEAKQKAQQTEADVQTKPPQLERVYLRLVDSHNQELLLSLKKVIDGAPGSTDVVLVLGPPETKQIIKLPTGVSKTPQIINTLCDVLGKENVKVQ